MCAAQAVLLYNMQAVRAEARRQSAPEYISVPLLASQPSQPPQPSQPSALPAQVKSSGAQAKDVFEISKPEMAFAEQEGARYHVVRVWGAASAAPRLQGFRDPLLMWRQRQLTVCMMV